MFSIKEVEKLYPGAGRVLVKDEEIKNLVKL